MITVHLLRHGETLWHAENRYAGSSDVALTDRGRRQAQQLAPWAATAGLDLVASSDLVRARETAAPVVAAAGVGHVVDPGLREVDFGQGEGMTRSEMSARFPEALDAFLSAPATWPLPGGEPGREAAARGLDALHRVVQPYRGGVVAVVAHSTLIRLLLCRVLGLPLDEYRARFPVMANATVTTLRLPPATSAEDWDGNGALLSFNAPVPGLS